VLHKIAPALGTLALLVVAGCAGAAPPPFRAARVQTAPMPYQTGTSAVTNAVARPSYARWIGAPVPAPPKARYR